MDTQQSAQGIASLGRNGDSMLVHMSPREVEGLQGLAMAQGGSLTINPDTGLPEAFSLRNMFASLIPTGIGFLLGGPAGAMIGKNFGAAAQTAAPILGGMAAGSLVAKSQGADPLMGAVTGGLGGWSGGSMGSAYMGATNPTITNAASSNIGSSLANQADDLASNTALNSVQGGKAGIDFNALAQNKISPGININPQTVPGNVLSTSSITKGAIPDAIPGLAETRGTLPSFTPQAAGGTSSPLFSLNKFTDQVGLPKLGMTAGTAVLSGLEPSDLYGEPFDPRTKDRYDPYARLNLNNDTGLRLLAEGGQIKDYAVGGAISSNPSVGGGLSDLYNRAEGSTTQPISNDGYGMGRLDRLASQESLEHAKNLGYAEGGDVGMNLDKLPSLNLNTAGGPSEDSSVFNPMTHLFGGSGISAMGAYPGISDPFGLTGSSAPGLYRGMPNPFGLTGQSAPQTPKSYALNLNSGKQEPQYAQGGYLDGQGDGMSDSIPATIEGKQPARLADGEFVVPADVVSHLGNGSSKAGSKRLYAMLDKVRRARTGTKKQGRQIKAEKYLPA